MYSKEERFALPTDKQNLEILYGEDDEVIVQTKNAQYVDISGYNPFLLHQYRVVNDNNFDHVKVELSVKSTIAASDRPIYLQIWDTVLQEWVTIASNNSAEIGSDIDFIETVSANISHYYDQNFEVAVRVYQENN